MRRAGSIAGLGAAALVVATLLVAAPWNEEEIAMATMDYAEFSAAAKRDLTFARPGDIIKFPPPETELFQTIRQNPRGWRPLVEQLVADPDVPYGTKFGTIGALGDLPPGERAEFLMVLLDRADAEPREIELADFFAGNLWRASSFLRASHIAGDDLYEHRGMTDVRAALERLWSHPALPPASAQPGTPLHDLFGDPPER